MRTNIKKYVIFGLKLYVLSIIIPLLLEILTIFNSLQNSIPPLYDNLISIFVFFSFVFLIGYIVRALIDIDKIFWANILFYASLGLVLVAFLYNDIANNLPDRQGYLNGTDLLISSFISSFIWILFFIGGHFLLRRELKISKK